MESACSAEGHADAVPCKLIEGRKLAPWNLGRVLVVGLGKSGKQAADFCASLLGTRVETLSIAAGQSNDVAQSYANELSARVQAGNEIAAVAVEFGDEGVFELARRQEGPFDLCIISPGIPYWERLYQDALAYAREVVSEVEFAWRESRTDALWVAVTGTNGKTTTTACCASVLAEVGLRARAVGNIGDVCLKAVLDDDTDVYVAEVSSYQLASTRLFAPNIALLMNITPDHVHWHKTLEAYRDAKFKVLENLDRVSIPGTPASRSEGRQCTSEGAAQERLAVAVLDATNDVVRAKVRELKSHTPDELGFSYVPLGTKEGFAGDMRTACGSINAAFIDADGRLRVAFEGVEHALCRVDELQIPGEHNAANALAAAVPAVVLGADDAAIASALRDFAPLEHRIEPCGVVAGVRCYNDSKATNVDATLKALEAFPDASLIVLLGGDDKGTNLDDLVSSAQERARAVVCFGASAPRFFAAFEQAAHAAPEGFVVTRAAQLEDALDRALTLAKPGEVLLLSPACASFDEFTSFEHRGNVFKQLVAARAN